MAISFYGGMFVGMQLHVNVPHEKSTDAAAAATTSVDFDKRVQAEVERRMNQLKSNQYATEVENSGKRKKGNTQDKNARFPSTVSSFAAGIALVSKNDFLANFDYGIPKVCHLSCWISV